jgi:hypothetical protein
MTSAGRTKENIDSLQERICLIRRVNGGIFNCEPALLITYDIAMFGKNRPCLVL